MAIVGVSSTLESWCLQYGQRIKITPKLEQMLEPDMGVSALHPRIYG